MNLPEGKFGVILADPPWRFGTWSKKGRDRCPDHIMTRGVQRQNRPERHYQTMTTDDIKTLPVHQTAAKDCCLFLWTTDSFLPQALEVGMAWGFTYKTVAFYWVKTRSPTNTRSHCASRPYPMGTGYWTRANPEQCLLFTRGKPKRVSASVEKLIISQRREHSRKPDEIYGRIESLVNGPYLELFARQTHPGWTAWGNECEKFSPLELVSIE